MTFAFVVAGLTEAFLLPRSRLDSSRNQSGTVRGLVTGSVLGPVWNLCSACIVPVAGAFHRRVGAGGTIAMVQGSATLNIPALVMVALCVQSHSGHKSGRTQRAGRRLVVAPLVASVITGQLQAERGIQGDPLDSWSMRTHPGVDVLRDRAAGLGQIHAFRYLVRLGPVMVVAGFASGLVIQWIDTSFVATYLGDSLGGVAIAATIGILINVPLLFEIPLVALLLLLGMGTAPAAALLFTAAAGEDRSHSGDSQRSSQQRRLHVYGTATWAIGLLGGAVLLGIRSVAK